MVAVRCGEGARPRSPIPSVVVGDHLGLVFRPTNAYKYMYHVYMDVQRRTSVTNVKAHLGSAQTCVQDLRGTLLFGSVITSLITGCKRLKNNSVENERSLQINKSKANNYI